MIEIEIERKFLVADEQWRPDADAGIRYRQGYLAKSAAGTVRVRCCGDEASLTVKSPRRGLTRKEFSYPIPIAEAEEILRLCGRVVEKVRHVVKHQGNVWHVDAYLGAAEGLVIAEIELDREGQTFATPPWLGADISFDPRYRNSAIARWRTASDRAGPVEPRSFRPTTRHPRPDTALQL